MSIEKYLNKYRYGNYTISPHPAKLFEAAVIIPVFNETVHPGELIGSLQKNDHEFSKETLFLFVINNSVSADEKIRKKNSDYLGHIISIIEKNEFPNIGFIDAFSPGCELEDKNAGVGLARKIGMDAVLPFLNGRKIIICLDADCLISENYLEKIFWKFNLEGVETAYAEFSHTMPRDKFHNDSIMMYEIYLRYYVCGLLYAGSPYAQHTIGSTMMCTVDAYIKTEGMNKRKAAEDFYFMEKLRKNYQPHRINCYVYPSARVSDRVPFGTGRTMQKYLGNNAIDTSLYDPRIFILLKQWLEIFMKIDANPYEIRDSILASEPNLADFFDQIKLIESLQNIIKNSKTESSLNLQKMRWFDGFKTLKFVHYLRASQYPSFKFNSALSEFLSLTDRQNDFKKHPIGDIKSAHDIIKCLENKLFNDVSQND